MSSDHYLLVKYEIKMLHHFNAGKAPPIRNVAYHIL